eukprot:1187852-Prorocentrum_minimum.AAC.2
MCGAGLRRKIAGKSPEEIKAFSQSVPPVSMQDLTEAIARISPSVGKAREAVDAATEGTDRGIKRAGWGVIRLSGAIRGWILARIRSNGGSALGGCRPTSRDTRSGLSSLGLPSQQLPMFVVTSTVATSSAEKLCQLCMIRIVFELWCVRNSCWI